MAWRLSTGVAAAAAVALPWAAVAQQSAAPPVQPGDRLQEVDLIGEILYDSNVAGAGAALASVRRVQPSDVIFEPKLHFTLARPLGRETVYLLGDAGYDFHARNTILNRENIDIHPGVLAQIGRCQTGLTGEYSRAQSDLSELAKSPIGLAVTLDQKNVLQVEQVGGNATCGGAIGFGPSVAASETWTQNSSMIQRYVDAQTFSGSGGLTYQRPVLGSVRLFGAFSQTDFPNRTGLVGIPGAGVATGYQTLSGGVTYTRAVGSRLEGSVSVSYTKLDQQGSTTRGFSGATYSAALSYRLSSRLNASGVVSRATVPSNRLNSTFYIQNLYSGRVSYALTSRLTFGGGASLEHDAYNVTPQALSIDLTDEKVYDVFADANLQLTRRLGFELDVEHRQLDANYAGLSYPDTRVGLTARVTF